MQADWYHLKDPDTVASPALLVYPQQVEMNIDRMIAIAGGPGHLMPHVKTHKMKPIVQMQLDKGIHRFKCATFAEALMLAEAGAQDILMAYQLTTPVAEQFALLAKQYPKARFSSLVDNLDSAMLLNNIFGPPGDQFAAGHLLNDIDHPPRDHFSNIPAPESAAVANVYIDIDNGMHRTGLAPEKVFALYEQLQSLPHVRCLGLHAYDGHIRDTDLAVRTEKCEAAFAVVAALAARMPGTEIIAGGSPTFPVHASRLKAWEQIAAAGTTKTETAEARDAATSGHNGARLTCSPGTCVLWDEGYGSTLPDQPFITAALLLTRVISKPQEGHMTLDLGHKAVSAENPINKRAFFHELDEYEAISQSEEHLVIKTPLAGRFKVGDVLYGTPWHVCPTVALYNEAQIIENGILTDTWPIARGRKLL